MKVLLVTVCTFVAAFAAPAANNAERTDCGQLQPTEDCSQLAANSELAAIRALPALEHDEVHDETGQYALRYATPEGIFVQQHGRLVPNLAGDGYVLITEGEYSFIGDDGKEHFIKFSAGLDGTKVEGNDVPAAPESIVPNVAEVSEVPNYQGEGSDSVVTVPETVPVDCSESEETVDTII